MAAAAQAGQVSADCKPDARKTKVVRQADGGEVIRLAGLTADQASAAPSAKAVSVQGPRMEPLLESMLAPRLMTALGTLPNVQRQAGQNLPEEVDPSLVRSWAEFIDPALALRWKVYAQTNGFTEALLQRPENGARDQKVGSGHVAPPAGQAPWVNTALSTTWNNVVSEGAKHSLTGQQAIQEWLMLPTPEPKANPWLSNLGSYRY